MSALTSFGRKYFALIVVGATYAWSVVAINLYRAAETPPGTITLRLGHWQLDGACLARRHLGTRRRFG